MPSMYCTSFSSVRRSGLARSSSGCSTTMSGVRPSPFQLRPSGE